jgi:4-hydroxythreonine-4-phosphate dehydrogenase
MPRAALPRLAVTMGDPAGIGPEVVAKALADDEVRGLARFAVFGPPLDQWAELAGVQPHFITHAHPLDAWDGHIDGVELIHPCDDDLAGIPQGAPSTFGGKASIGYIMAAIDAAKRNRVDGIVTGPISKEAVRMAGYPWPGHTELLAEKFGAAEVAMLFAGGPFRVVLVTIHMSLRDAIAALSTEKILSVCRLSTASLKKWFGIAEPRLGVCGLNPHASEAGQFGSEERTIIEPAIAAARAEGIDATGPLPPDTAFFQAAAGRFDLVVALYHDQGLIPIKTVAFEDSVNVTLGLPIVRTSVDHGTAYDIAGAGRANPRSMQAAVWMAVHMLAHRRP